MVFIPQNERPAAKGGQKGLHIILRCAVYPKRLPSTVSHAWRSYSRLCYDSVLCARLRLSFYTTSKWTPSPTLPLSNGLGITFIIDDAHQRRILVRVPGYVWKWTTLNHEVYAARWKIWVFLRSGSEPFELPEASAVTVSQDVTTVATILMRKFLLIATDYTTLHLKLA